MPEVGERIGSIRIVRTLGVGGMGEVYEGFDETLQRKVALKTIKADRRLGSGAKARFLREARVLSHLDHPSICRIYDYVEEGDSAYLVLELIEGATLDDETGAGLGEHSKLDVARQIAEVLAAAHAEGIIHRDLKPGNVMLTPSGQVKVLDFGLARAARAPRPSHVEGARGAASDPDAGPDVTLDHDATLDSAAADPDVTLQEAVPKPETGSGGADASAATSGRGDASSPTPFALMTAAGRVIGTPLYMSPEQARGQEITTASDLYSFGLLLQTLFTGRAPYPQDIRAARLIQLAKRGETLPVTGIDSDLAALIERLKTLAPAARPTAVETLERLDWIRDKPKRRLRRLAAAAVAALVLLAGLKYTTDLRRERAHAVAARELADQRRVQAEDLIDFMLGDLRKKLEPLGQLGILDEVGEKAMDYYAAVDEAQLSDEELLSRSRALYQIGEVRIGEGRLDDAVRPLEESLALARSLVERSPNDGERLFEAGQAHFWVGFVHWRRGDLAAALAQFEEYRAISERLVALDPSNLDWQLELSYAHSNIGSILQTQGKLDEALARFQAALAVHRRLVAADARNTDWKLELARSYNTVAYIFEAQGNFAGALDNYRSELAIKEELAAAQPDHAQWQYELGINHGLIGQLRAAMGELDDALEHYRVANEKLAALTRRDPANTPWARQLAATQTAAGRALTLRGHPTAGRRQLGSAIETLERLVSKDPTDTGWQRDLAAGWTEMGRAWLASGEPGEARPAAQAALEILEALVAKRPDDRMALAALTAAHDLLGAIAAAQGSAEQARREWSRAVETLAAIGPDSSDHRLLAPLVSALLQLGRTAEAEPLVERLRSFGYKSPELDSLWSRASTTLTGAD